MKIESVACHVVNNRQSGKGTAVVRNALEDTKKGSNASTTSTADDLEMTEYRSFPVDDDVFEFTSSNRTSLISDPDSGNDLEDAGRVSYSDENDRHVGLPVDSTAIGLHDSSPLVGTVRRSPMFDKKISVFHPEISTMVQSEAMGDRANESHSKNSSKDNRQSYYVQGDDISPDSLSNCSSAISTVGSSDVNTHCPVSKRFMPFLRTHEVWKEIGPEGGVLELTGCGVSFHVLSDKTNGKDWMHRTKRSQHAFSITINRLGSLQSAYTIDRRMVLALDDVPPIVNNRFRVAIGSMVSVDYGSLELLSQGAVLQIEVNAALKEAAAQNVSRICKFGCLIASSVVGPYHKVTDDCYYYGNTLQIFISASDIRRISSDASGDVVAALHLVPVAIVKEEQDSGTKVSVWHGISSMLLWVAVYGPMRSHVCNTCCVYVSSATVCPPTISLEKSSKTLSLHLWTAYRLNLKKPEDIEVFLQREPPDASCTTVIPNTMLIEAADIKCLSQINKLITVKYTNDFKSSESVISSNSKGSYSCHDRTKERFMFSLLGLESREMLLAVTFVAPIRSPYWSTPVKRWKRNDRVIPRPSSYCGVATDTQNFLDIWYDSQREAVTKLKPTFVIPGSDTKVKFLHYAVAITSRRGKRSNNEPLLLDYIRSDAMPLLTNYTIWMQGTSKYKEWYLSYSRGRIGFIHTKCVKITKYDPRRLELSHVFTASELINCLTERIGDLTFCFSTLKVKLLKRCIDWRLFSCILGFAENYVSRVVRQMNNDSTKDIAEKFELYLDRFSEYCDSGNRTRKMHQDVVRGLLYMGEYSLAVDLLTDFCIWTLSPKLGNAVLHELKLNFDTTNRPTLENLPTLENILVPPRTSTFSPPNAEYKGVESSGFEWLCKQRRWYGNDEEFLKHLHHAISQLKKSIIKCTPFSYALILALSIPCLRKK